MIKNLENEIWKDIKGLNGEYQVSNKGRIKSKERFVKFGKTTYRKGYSLAGISFCCNHKRDTYKGMIWSFTSNG